MSYLAPFRYLSPAKNALKAFVEPVFCFFSTVKPLVDALNGQGLRHVFFQNFSDKRIYLLQLTPDTSHLLAKFIMS